MREELYTGPGRRQTLTGTHLQLRSWRISPQEVEEKLENPKAQNTRGSGHVIKSWGKTTAEYGQREFSILG